MKVSIALHAAPGARVAPHPLVRLKSPESVPWSRTFNPLMDAPFLGSVIVTVFWVLVAPVAPKTTLPKLILGGEAFSPADAANAAGAAVMNTPANSPEINPITAASEIGNRRKRRFIRQLARDTLIPLLCGAGYGLGTAVGRIDQMRLFLRIIEHHGQRTTTRRRINVTGLGNTVDAVGAGNRSAKG